MLLGARSPEGDAVVAGLPSLASAGWISSRHGRCSPGLRDAASEEQVRLLHRATEGNPLALLELRAADLDVIESVETGLPLRVPRAVADAFGRRLEQLDGETRAVLLVAAVCGADMRLITDACPRSGVDVGRLGEAEDLGLVTVRGGAVEFRHPLLRAAVYSGASVQERRAAHRAAADATPGGDVDRRAWHLSEAIWHPDAGVADLLAEAGEHAIARAAYSVASGAFERSARLTPDADGARARLLRAADTAWTAGNGERALALLDQRARDAGRSGLSAPDGVREIELRASIAARTGSLREALDFLLVAADRAESADAKAIALADAVHATYYLGDARTASVLADRLGGAERRRRRAEGACARAHGDGHGADARGARRCRRHPCGGAAARDGSGPDARSAPAVVAAAGPAVPARCDERRAAACSRRRGARRRGCRCTAGRALPCGGRPGDDRRVVGAGGGELHRGDPPGDRDGAGDRARDVARGSGAARLAGRSGRRVSRPRRGGADRCALRATSTWAKCGSRTRSATSSCRSGIRNSLSRCCRTGLAARAARADDVDLAPAPELVDALLRLGRRDEAIGDRRRVSRGRRCKGQPWALARADRAWAWRPPTTSSSRGSRRRSS